MIKDARLVSSTNEILCAQIFNGSLLNIHDETDAIFADCNFKTPEGCELSSVKSSKINTLSKKTETGIIRVLNSSAIKAQSLLSSIFNLTQYENKDFLVPFINQFLKDLKENHELDIEDYKQYLIAKIEIKYKKFPSTIPFSISTVYYNHFKDCIVIERTHAIDSNKMLDLFFQFALKCYMNTKTFRITQNKELLSMFGGVKNTVIINLTPTNKITEILNYQTNLQLSIFNISCARILFYLLGVITRLIPK